MDASVIVCTRDRATLLDRLLGLLAAQTVPADRFEVIVVDDHSTDRTPKVLRRWGERLPHLRGIVLERHEGLGAAGNRALAAATGDFLLFTDDDCLPRPDWVEEMVTALSGAPIVAGAMASPEESYFQLCHNVAQFHPFLVPGPARRRLEFVAGANLGVRREVMNAVGGMDPETPIPDMEWLLRARRLGLGVAFAPAAVITHDPSRHSLRSVLDYSASHAEHTIRLRWRYRDVLPMPLVLRSRLLVQVAAPLIALHTTAGIYGRNPSLWRRAHTLPVVFLAKMAWCRGAARGLASITGRSSSLPGRS
jgi:glycosyltransferase involved in cell wall biosynthesis